MEPTWSDSLACGINGIDHQHQEIFARFDYFSEACEEGAVGTELLALLEFLDNYTVIHFAEEEGFLQKSGYPDLGEHRKEHRKFLQDLARLRVQILDAGPGDITAIAMRRELREWLIEHIGKVDRAYVEFVQKAKAGEKQGLGA